MGELKPTWVNLSRHRWT